MPGFVDANLKRAKQIVAHLALHKRFVVVGHAALVSVFPSSPKPFTILSAACSTRIS